MRHVPRALLAGALGLAVSLLVACGGGSGLLSGDQANSLNGQLDQVSSAVQAGDCGAASSAVNQFSATLMNLPVTVSQTLRNNLSVDATKLGVLAARDCRNATSTTTPKTTTTTSTATIPTTTVTTTTQSTSTSTPSNPGSTPTPPATTPSNPGTTSSGGNSGGAGIGGGSSRSGSSGGAGAGNGNGQ